MSAGALMTQSEQRKATFLSSTRWPGRRRDPVGVQLPADQADLKASRIGAAMRAI
jgi:hypothetical protein